MIPDAMIRERSHQKDEFITPMLMLLIALCVILWCHWVIKKPKKANPPLPPGPWGLPLVGNLFSLESDLHPCLANLSKRYGPIMKIKLGTRVCIVINSASVAKEVFKDHDTIFSNHDISPVAYAGTWSGTDMVFSPYGEHWRMLRKICVRELLSNSQLEALYYLRRREVRNMVIQMYAKGCKSIDIGDYVLTLTFSVMTNILWGGTLEGEEMKHFSAKFPEACEKFTSLLKSPNVSDLFPLLTRFDMQGLVTKMKKVNLWFDENLDFVINRRFEMKHQVEMTDFLQRLMEFKECGDQKVPFTTTHIKALLMDMLLGGTKTSATTVEMAMTELLRHPELMRKAQEEIEEVVGNNNVVEESHCLNLHYVNAIVKETLRLQPATPLLVPRCPSESCTISGYTVPKGAKIIVNAWAIQRDSTYWDNPLEFQPDRFLHSNGKGDYSGSNPNFIPLGSGRRVCVGIPLAERMIPYILASLLHSFNWKLPEQTTINMPNFFEMVLKRRTPLIAIPTPRLSDPKLYT